MKAKMGPALLGLLCLASNLPLAAVAQDHAPEILGIRIGMTAGQVFEILQRPGDADKEERGELVIFWNLESGDVLQVNFWKDHVSGLALKYKVPRPASELGLVAQVDQRSSLDARDPRAEFGYRESETNDKSRIVWSRPAESQADYGLEVRFLSGSRQQFGQQRYQYVEYKYVSVPKSQLKKFRRSIRN